MSNKMTIRPHNPIHMISIALLVVFAVSFAAFAIYRLFLDEPLTILDLIVIEKGYVQFAIALPIALLFFIAIIRAIMVRITFLGDMMSAPKYSEMQKEPFQERCSDLVKYEVAYPLSKKNVTIYQYIVFVCADNSEKRLWIKPYTKKQVRKMLEIIKAKGGLHNQSSEDL